MNMRERLPNAEAAQVDLIKLTDYLMALEHPRGKAKAKFFIQFGFSLHELDLLVDSLKKHALTQPVIETKSSEYGLKYVLECTCETPDNRNPCIRSVWIVEEGNASPRLVTAHPS
jgi:hypothetical protein